MEVRCQYVALGGSLCTAVVSRVACLVHPLYKYALAHGFHLNAQSRILAPMVRSPQKKPGRKPSRAQPSRNATKVTSIYPNGAQQLKFQVGKELPAMPVISKIAYVFT